MEQGKILIDGVDIANIPLAVLREEITIIQQDSTLFQGTLKYNLDPLDLVSEEHIVEMLKVAGLDNLLDRDNKSADLTTNEPTSKSRLQFKVEEGGKNLSSGEKQLLCICRAVLRNKKIVLVDEATSNIDIKTEKQIEKLMK